MDICRTIETRTPLAQVFPYLSDFTTTEEWDPGTLRTERLSGDGGVGTRYRNVSKFLGRETELEYVTQEVVPSSRFIVEGNNSSARTTDTMTFSETPGGGTRVDYTAQFEFKGATGKAAVVLSPLLALALKRLGDKTADSMRAALDALSPQGTS